MYGDLFKKKIKKIILGNFFSLLCSMGMQLKATTEHSSPATSKVKNSEICYLITGSVHYALSIIEVSIVLPYDYK
jgi:hypothetical protein